MTNFTFDGAHSSLEFQIKHLMVSKVKGSFDQFDVAVEGDINDFSTLKATATIIPSSINTKNEARDNHLKSGDFFGTDEFDKITFETKSVSESKVVGDLTIKGITNEETFDDVAVEGDINDFSTLKATATIIPSSINTKNEARDNHLKSGDFFGTDEFDKITFETKSVSESKVVGDLTIKGITNEETFDDVAVEGDINDFSTLKATATIIPSSINTKNEARDNHLKSGDFFGTDEFDKITFETKSVSESKVVGDLTIKGITNEETFDDVAVEGDINDFSTLKATATIIPSSINTKNEARDNHLKSGDFFGTDEFDKITFETKSVSESKVVGDLTIKGITNEETFDVEFNGVSKNPMDGSQVTGVIVTGTINREKYGINFNQALETGGVMLGKDVKFEASAEFSISE